MSTHRLLFLGSGFSCPAGLPLGNHLFTEVRRRIIDDYGSDNHVEHDLKRFIDYQQHCFNRIIKPENVNCEEFLGFLDVEHYLGLKGKDTWSAEGNESQLMIRHAIAKVIHARTPVSSNIPDIYRSFVRQLTTTDYVLTFNYDTLLERTFELEGIPYRLFPQRYSEVQPLSCVVDTEHDDEVVLIKLHGSVDWFSRSRFDESIELLKSAPNMYPQGHQISHPIFGYDAIVTPTPITDGPRPKSDMLTSLYRVVQLDKVLVQPWSKCTPFILSPSTTKLFYVQPMLEFWNGLQRAGGLQLSLGIIGYSLPRYDDYAMQAIYHIARNYQYYEPDLVINGRKKTKVRIVDFQPTESAATAFRDRYRFLNWDRTETHFSGFDSKAVDWLMR